MQSADQTSSVENVTSNTFDEPLYNIGVVERLTGIPIATLRVWERRYGFPKAARTEGGHRIYTEREVARLRWVKARVDEGLQASKAVHALEVTEAQGRYPEPPRVDAPRADQPSGSGTLDTFHKRLTDLLLAHDLAAADQLLGNVLALYSIDELILDVLRPVLVDIGEGWAAGQVTVATEHLASQFVRERLLKWMPVGPAPHPVRPTVLACAPDEWHDISLLMLGVMLRRRRWPVAYLGQATPLQDLADFVTAVRPPAVVVVAMRERSAIALRDWPSHMLAAAETGRPAVCYAGSAFTSDEAMRKSVPGLFLGPSLVDGLDRVEAVLREVTGVV